MKRTIIYQVLALVLGLAGLGLMIWIDWRIALGVFLFIWSENMRRVA